MTLSATPRHGFPGLLRHWRRQRRLSQLELALSAEVSQRHLSFLESGRARPSRDMVLRLAEGLDLPLRECNHLLGAAGHAAAYSVQRLDDADMAPVRQALALLLGHHEPFPALVVDSEWNLLMANAGVMRLLAVFGDPGQVWQRVCPDGRLNVVKLTLHPEGLAPFIENFDEVAANMLCRMQREVALRPALQPLIDDLLACPGMPGRRALPDGTMPGSPLLLMRLRFGETRLALFTTITTFGTAQDVTTDELRVESFFPADAATERWLRSGGD